MSEVQQVLVPHVGDIHEIQCVRDKQVSRGVPTFDLRRPGSRPLDLDRPSCLQGREVWFQVKIPLSRNLTVGCSPAADAGAQRSPGHPCPPQVPFLYLPINHEQPQEPCG